VGENCAHKLGIGIPQIFIYNSPYLDAYTFATDDIEPMIVLSSAIVEALDLSELEFVVGHECGHIHNLHSVYNTAVELVTNQLLKTMLSTFPGLRIFNSLIQGVLIWFFFRWSRCAEITCDRAGLICCGNLKSAQMALAKLTTGGESSLSEVNLDEYINQITQVKLSPLRFYELVHSHPLIHKRIKALEIFSRCDLMKSWLPDYDITSYESTLNIQETDRICENIVSIIKKSNSSSFETNDETLSSPPKTIPID
jgi:Zn-dependent protease with chaperone function